MIKYTMHAQMGISQCCDVHRVHQKPSKLGALWGHTEQRAHDVGQRTVKLVDLVATHPLSHALMQCRAAASECEGLQRAPGCDTSRQYIAHFRKRRHQLRLDDVPCEFSRVVVSACCTLQDLAVRKRKGQVRLTLHKCRMCGMGALACQRSTSTTWHARLRGGCVAALHTMSEIPAFCWARSYPVGE